MILEIINDVHHFMLPFVPAMVVLGLLYIRTEIKYSK